MNAYEIMDMRVEDFIASEFARALDFEIRPDYSSEFSLEVPLNSGGSYFDTSFGNYLPVDPDMGDIDVYGIAVASIKYEGEVLASAEFELDGLFDDPDAYELDFDDYSGPYIPHIETVIEDYVESHFEEELYEDAAWYLVDNAIEEIEDILQKDPNMTVRDFLGYSNIFKIEA